MISPSPGKHSRLTPRGGYVLLFGWSQLLTTFFHKLCGRSSPDASLDGAEAPIWDILARLAFSWTHDHLQARQLLASVLRDVEEYGGYNRLRHDQSLDVYICLYRHWCSMNRHADAPISMSLLMTSSEQMHIQQCLCKLPTCQRVVLTLVDIAELSYADIGRIIDVGEHRIRSWVSQARMHLLQQIAR